MRSFRARSTTLALDSQRRGALGRVHTSRDGGTTNDPPTLFRSASNTLSSRSTSTISERAPLIFRRRYPGIWKRGVLGSDVILLQRTSAGLSRGWRIDTNTGNTGSRASALMNRRKARYASRLAESRDRHGLRGNSRPAVQRRFI